MTEQEVVSIAYCNPKIFESCSKYSHLGSPKDSQDAPGLKQCIFDTFKEDKVGDLIPKIKFLSSDGASVNSGKHSGLIRLIQEELPWVSFIWCFSHRLELTLKDSLKSFIDSAESHFFTCFIYIRTHQKKYENWKTFTRYWENNLKHMAKILDQLSQLEQDGLTIAFRQWKSLLISLVYTCNIYKTLLLTQQSNLTMLNYKASLIN